MNTASIANGIVAAATLQLAADASPGRRRSCSPTWLQCRRMPSNFQSPLKAASLRSIALQPPACPRSRSKASSTQPVSLTARLLPGEIVSIFGCGLGPAEPGYAGYIEPGKLAPVTSGARAIFEGVPATMLFARNDQLNAIVPFEIDGLLSAQLQVEYEGVLSNTVSLPVQPASPALFTQDASGAGPAAINNEDLTRNSPTHTFTSRFGDFALCNRRRANGSTRGQWTHLFESPPQAASGS